MNEKIFNLGVSLAYPYESKYSIWRRFLSANQRFKLEEICEIFGVPVRTKSNMLNAPKELFPKVIETVFEGQYLPAYFTLIETAETGTDYFSIAKHCPDCASSGYHTDLFRANWLKHCPIHKKKFLNKCNECGKPWPTWSEIGKRKCSTCGLAKIASKPTSSNPIKDFDFDIIEKLMGFLFYRPLKEAALVSNSGIAPFQQRTGSYFHEFFPAFQLACSKERSLSFECKDSLNIKQDSNIRSFDTTIHKDPSEINRVSNWVRPSFGDKENRVRQQVLNNITEKLEKVTCSRHVPKVYNLSAMVPDDLLGQPSPCRYCLSISYWVALTRSGEAYLTDVSFSRLHPHVIESRFPTPKYWDNAVFSGNLFKLPSYCSDVLYQLTLEHLFMSIFMSFESLGEHNKQPKAFLEKEWPKLITSISKQLSIFVSEQNEELRISAINFLTLKDELLADNNYSAEKCSRFETNLYEKRLYGLVESDLKSAEQSVDSIFNEKLKDCFDKKFTIPVLRLTKDS